MTLRRKRLCTKQSASMQCNIITGSHFTREAQDKAELMQDKAKELDRKYTQMVDLAKTSGGSAEAYAGKIGELEEQIRKLEAVVLFL